MKKQRKALFNLPGLEKVEQEKSSLNEKMNISEILDVFCNKHYGDKSNIVKAHILKYIGDFRARHNRNLSKSDLIHDLENIIKGMSVEEVMATVENYSTWRSAQGVPAFKWFKKEEYIPKSASKDECDSLKLNLEPNEEKRKKLRKLCDM